MSKNKTNQEEFLYENKEIVKLDKKMNKLKKDLDEYKNTVFLSENMLNFQSVIVLSTTLIFALFGGLFSLDNFITSFIKCGAEALTCSSVLCIGASAYFYVVKQKYEKKIELTQLEFILLEETKKTLEKTLTNELNNDKVINNSVLIENNNIEFCIDEKSKVLTKKLY